MGDYIDAAIPENRAALYRTYLQRLSPDMRTMRAEIDAEADDFPDLLARSPIVLRTVLQAILGE